MIFTSNFAVKLAKAFLYTVMAIAALATAAIVLVGCAMSDPASRATSATYGDISITVAEGATAEVHLTIGDGAVASADSTGSTETTTASPSNTISPQTDLNMSKSASSGGIGTLGALVDTVVNGITGGGNGNTAKANDDEGVKAPTTTTKAPDEACADGDCTFVE